MSQADWRFAAACGAVFIWFGVALLAGFAADQVAEMMGATEGERHVISFAFAMIVIGMPAMALGAIRGLR